MNYDRGIEWTLDDLAERAVDLADNYGSRARACMAVMPANISAYDALNRFSLFAEEMRLADLRGRGWGPWQPSERLTDLENLTVLTAICASGKEIDHLSQLVELTHFAGFLAGPTLTPALTAIVDEIFRSGSEVLVAFAMTARDLREKRKPLVSREHREKIVPFWKVWSPRGNDDRAARSPSSPDDSSS